MKKFIWVLLAMNIMLAQFAYGAPKLTSRYLLFSDAQEDSVAGISLREEWWSRPYEYEWASQFVGEDLVVFDAACGVSYPFKWFLNLTCKETWACDLDSLFSSLESIFEDTKWDLGEEAYRILTQNPSMYENVHLFQDSICTLPRQFKSEVQHS